MNVTDEATAPPTVEWVGDPQGSLRLLDQTKLPLEEIAIDCRTSEDVWEAIKSLRVRGAPAIGVAAGYGVVVGVQLLASSPRAEFDAELARVCDYLATSRPTAVNLFWALQRMRSVAESHPALSSREMLDLLLEEAREIESEDRQMCSAIGRHGSELMPAAGGVLTHCNAGGLATAGDGTALAVLFAAHKNGKQIQVYADETRPLLQGARLTAWELMRRNVPTTLICDSMAGQVMKEGRIQAVVVGADRIAANGDSANKIGTYSVAVLANAHKIPFYVAAPSSTFDLSLTSGDQIPIEQRASEEITEGLGRRTAPENVEVYNPAFDVTPARLISGIITEKGVIQPVNAENVKVVLGVT